MENRLIHDRIDAKSGLRVELFESIGQVKPFRIRLIDTKTLEVGPQIRMYEELGPCAMFYQDHTSNW